MLCAPPATGYSMANSSTGLDWTRLDLVQHQWAVHCLLTWPCFASAPVELFTSVRSAEVGSGFACSSN